MDTDSNIADLDELIGPLFPQDVRGFGQWSWLATQIGVSRASVSKWRDRNAVPLLRVLPVCRLLGASADIERELLRRGGINGPSVLHGETVAPESAPANL